MKPGFTHYPSLTLYQTTNAAPPLTSKAISTYKLVILLFLDKVLIALSLHKLILNKTKTNKQTNSQLSTCGETSGIRTHSAIAETPLLRHPQFQKPRYYGHPANTETPLSRTPRYYRQESHPQSKLQSVRK